MYRGLVLFLLGLAMAPAAARGDEPAKPAESTPEQAQAQVKLLVREAGALMDRGDRAGAVAKLLQARRLRPDPSLDYNLGIAYAEWGKGPEAAAALSRFLATVSGPAVTRDRVQDAERRMAAYKAELARVTIQLAPGPTARATVLIDSQTLGPAPVAEHWLAPGPHDVRVTAPGARDYQVAIQAVAGQEQTVLADLVPVPAGPTAGLVPPGQDRPEPPPPLHRRWWFWVAVGSGAALAAGLIGAAAAGRLNHTAAGSDLPPVEVAP